MDLVGSKPSDSAREGGVCEGERLRIYFSKKKFKLALGSQTGL